MALVGDSLAVQAAPDFDRLLAARGVTVANEVLAGTAACDWLATIAHLAMSPPRAVVLELSGDAFTSCMKGCPPESAAAVSKYCADLGKAIDDFLAAGTKVFLIGAPITYAQWVNHDPHWDDLNLALIALASRHPHQVFFANAGRAVEGPGGAFAWTLPCLAHEPCGGPSIAGVPSDAVRAPDGVHFCTPLPKNELGCSGYSSGAFRFADAMAQPVLKSLGL